MNKRITLAAAVLALGVISCGTPQEKETADKTQTDSTITQSDDFKYTVDRFADVRIIRYQVPGFEELPKEKKVLLYYLHEAAMAGRDIIYDQNYRHNLQIRKVLEAVVMNENEIENKEEFDELLVYTKRIWFSNGIHHHYSNAKFEPGFSREYFTNVVNEIPADQLPLKEGEGKEEMIATLAEVIFNPEIDAKKVSLEDGEDLVQTSAVNYYGEGLTQKEVEAYYENLPKTDGPQPEYGLNTQLVKKDGKVVANTWKVGGMYTEAIENIVKWLEKAKEVAENEQQKLAFEKLIKYYHSGDVHDWDIYNIAWVNDTNSRTDVINGFVEVYNDPLGYKGSFESVVSFKDMEATKRIEAVGKEAQWFEDNSPLMEEHKKKNVKGISGKVITVVAESGDASPATPIGINLPNNNWVREQHGSKSVSLGNIVEAYELSSKEGKSSLTEFAYSEEEVARAKKYGNTASILHTDLHEVIGHASGVINEGVGTPKETLKSYASALEEGRADLVALYFIHDEKLIELGLIPSLEVGKAAYDSYIKNGMMLQLRRLEKGEQIEESHMRNRQLVAQWAFEKGAEENVIEKKVKDGKTYFVINDYDKLRDLFGQLLREIQRIKSEGDFEAGRALVENYGVKVDSELHDEVLKRFEDLHIAPYGGFINPKLVPVVEDGNVVDVKIEYPMDFKEQMLHYGKKYSFLNVQ